MRTTIDTATIECVISAEHLKQVCDRLGHIIVPHNMWSDGLRRYFAINVMLCELATIEEFVIPDD